MAPAFLPVVKVCADRNVCATEAMKALIQADLERLERNLGALAWRRMLASDAGCGRNYK